MQSKFLHRLGSAFCISMLVLGLGIPSLGKAQTLRKYLYEVRFSTESTLVEPATANNTSIVPPGITVSLQDPAPLKAALSLQGEIVSINNALNSINVYIDAEEAARLRADSRIYAVTNNSIEYSIVAQMPGSYPVYEAGKLLLPRIDTAAQVGRFQNGVLEFEAASDAWRLQSFSKTPATSIFILSSDGVFAQVTDTFPAQVIVRIFMSTVNSCTSPGPVELRQTGSRFELWVNLVPTYPELEPGTYACAAAIASYEVEVPLPVYGLDAGTYTWLVNNIRIGEFTLVSDNRL